MMQNIFSEKKIMYLAGLVFLLFLVYRVVMVFFPHPDAGGVENNVTWFIQQLLNGNTLYTNPEASPYSIAQYSPLYYYLCAAICKIAGVSSEEVFSVFMVSRVVSLLLNLLYAALLFFTARNVFKSSFISAWLAAVAGFVFLEITSYSRPDSLYHTLSLASIYFFLKYINTEDQHKNLKRLLVLSAIVGAAAFFSKQSALIVPIIAVIWFLHNKSYKDLLLYFTCYAASIVVGLLLIQLSSGLVPWYQNAVLGLNNGVSFHWFWENIIGSFYQQWGLLWLALFIAVVLLALQSDQKVNRFLWIAMISFFLFTNLIALKWGSSPGYFTEWIGLALIGAAAFAPTLIDIFKRIHPAFLYLFITVVLTIKTIRIYYPLTNSINKNAQLGYWNRYENEKQVGLLVKKYLANSKNGKVFCNIYTPESWLTNFLYKESVLPQFEVVIFGTWKQKAYDYSHFRNDFVNGEIQYIVCKTKDAGQKFIDIEFNKYTLKDSLHGYYLYEYHSR
jgi:hypothetical protein